MFDWTLSLLPYSKTCVKRPLSKRPKIGFQDQLSLSLNAGQKYCSSILQYFRPSLSYHFCLFLIGSFTQVELYSVSARSEGSSETAPPLLGDTISTKIGGAGPYRSFYFLEMFVSCKWSAMPCSVLSRL